MKEALAKFGSDPRTGSPQEFDSFMRAETKKWSGRREGRRRAARPINKPRRLGAGDRALSCVLSAAAVAGGATWSTGYATEQICE